MKFTVTKRAEDEEPKAESRRYIVTKRPEPIRIDTVSGAAPSVKKPSASFTGTIDSVSGAAPTASAYRRRAAAESSIDAVSGAAEPGMEGLSRVLNSMRSTSEIEADINRIEEERKKNYEHNLDLFFREQRGEAVEEGDYLPTYALYDDELEELWREWDTAKSAENAYLKSQGYRDANLWDLTGMSLARGYITSRYGQELNKMMEGKENRAEEYRQMLEGDSFRFITDGRVQDAVSGGAELLGQQARQYTDPRSLTLAGAAGLGAALVGQAGLQALVPEEIISVPAAMAAGFQTGSTRANYEIESGLAYKEMIDNGISEDTARAVARAVGAGNAALELAQMDELFKAFNVLKRKSSTSGVSQMVMDEILRRVGSAGLESAQEVAQEGVTILGNQAAGYLESGQFPYTSQEVLDRLEDTAYSSFLSFGALNIPAAAHNIFSSANQEAGAGRTRSGPRRATEPQQTAAEFTAQAEPETAAARPPEPVRVRQPDSPSEEGGDYYVHIFDKTPPEPERVRQPDSPSEEGGDYYAHIFDKTPPEPEQAQNDTAASTGETAAHRMTMEDFTNVDSPVWNNVAYEDTETQRQITQRVHQEMVDEGAVVTVPESTREQVGQSYPDLRYMKKAERTPILRQKMKELKGALRQFLNGLKGGTYEFEVNGNILEARLYDTGVREVLEKIDQSKASMLYHSDQVFQNARYLYSTPDYDGDPNIYRWNYFYTPVRIGDEIVGVRIAVRDLVETRNGRPESQIYNWGIKTGATLDGGRPSTKPPSSGVSSAAPEGATLDGGERGNMPDRSGVSSVVPSISSIPQTGGENNTNAVRDGGLTLPTASGGGAAAPRGDVRELTLPGGEPEAPPVLERVQQDGGDGIRRAAVFDTGVETPQGDVRELILPGEVQERAGEGGGPLYSQGPESSVGAARANFTGDTVRGFSSNLATDRARHHDIREDFELAPEKYFRLSNRETLKKAQDIFSAGLDSARSTVEQAIGAAQAGQKLSPEMVPLSKMVADALAARGDLDGARNILASMAAELTSAGQLGQAARILRDADPQATIDSVEKIVKKLNEELGSGGNGGTSGSTEITEKAYRALKESRDDAVRLIQNIISAFQDQSTEQTDPLSSRYRRTWVEQLGRELANRAAAFQTGRTSNPTAYQTILGDLTAFMNSYLSRRKQSTGAKRTAAERLADFFQNREEYAAAWNQAKDQLRARYGKDRQMMDRLEDFLNGTISYSGAGSDAVMLEAVTRAALENDVNMDRMIVRQQYDEDDLAGQVADTLIRQTGAEGSDQQIIRDAVLRHIREKTADAGRGSGDIIHRDIQNAMRKLGVRLSQVIEQGARSKEELARNIASVLSGEYGVSENVSQSLSQDIVDDFGRMVEEASRKKLKQIFSKRPKAERRTMEQAFERLVNLGAFYNGEYSGQAAGRVFGARAKGIQIDRALIDEFSRQTTDEGRADVLDKIYQNVADQIPSTLMDKFNALRYLNMLGNLKTQVRNVGGNLIMKGVRAQRVKLQAAMENLAERAARARGREFERTVSLTRDREIFKLAKAEFDRAAEEIMGERKYSYNGQSIPAAIQNRRTIFKNNGEWGLDGKGPASLLRRGADALMGGLEAYRRTVNNAMEGGDMIFAKGIYADALSRYLKANGVTAEQYRSGQVDEGLLDRARQWAVKEAQEATFRDSNAFSDMIAKIGFRNPKNGIEKAANMAVQGVLPFRRTPANVGVRAVEHSPLGLIDTAVKAAKVAKGSESVTSSDVIASLSKILTGTGLFALGVALGMGGMLSGLSSDDENEAELDEQEGGQAYALYLPDWLTGAVGLPEGFNLTLDWASPAAIPLFMGAELGNQAAGNGVQGKDILTALASSSNVLLNMSMLQGINDQLENVSYSENPLVDLTLNSLTDFWTAGLTSTLGGQIERTLEDVRMSTYTDENSELPTDLQYELGSQLARVPGVDYQQIPFVDGWGRTESSGHWLPRAGNQFLNPSYTSSDTSTPAIQETRRLYEATGDGGVVSKRPEKEITVDGQTKYLNAGEYLQYASERGQMRSQLVTDIIGRDAYQDMGAAEQAAVIKDVYSYTDAIAKSHISEYEPSSWVKKVEAYGVDPADAILYRAAKRALEDADVEGVNQELRSMLMADTSLSSGEKAAIDKAILSEKSKVDYSSQESFLISQMSDAAQSRWPGIRDRFGLSAEEYQEAVRIYNMDKDDGVTTADKKRMLREMFGWEGNAIYKALGKKADSDEED